MSTKESVLEDEGLLFHILSYVPHPNRTSVLLLSRLHATLLTSEASFKWRCDRLHAERGLYAPTHRLEPPPGKTWREVFEEGWERRGLWTGERRRVRKGDGQGDGSDKFRIRVCARLKPRGLAKPSAAPLHGSGSEGSKRIALPLHQRLALIRMNRNLSSRREALEVLREQGGWFPGADDEWSGRGEGADDGGVEEEKVAEEEKKEDAVVWIGGKRVPSSSSLDDSADERKETAGKSVENDPASLRGPIPPALRGGVHFLDKSASRVVVVDPTKGIREFAFDSVHDGTSQSDLYDSTALPLVGDVLNGYSATCLVYGQTGSGKTHAMFGPPMSYVPREERGVGGGDGEERAEGPGLGLDADERAEAWGIVPRACAQLFDALEHRRSHLSIPIESSVSVGYVEVFGDEVLNLLRGGSKVGHSSVAAHGYVLDGSSEVPAGDLDEVFRLLNAGEIQKKKAATAMNDRSSRAHTILVLTLRQKCAESGRERTSRLFLADLGGSERVKKSHPLRDVSNRGREHPLDAAVARANTTKDDLRLREAANINLGLLALKRCVERVVSGQRRKRRVHVPYSENKLTMILSPGLGGNSKTCVVVCAAQEAEHGAETVAALRFGQVCGAVVSKTTTSMGDDGDRIMRDLLMRLDETIAKCEENIRKHERWEVREERRVDERAEDGDARVEIVSTTVLVGADMYRKELEELLRKRAELVGEQISVGGSGVAVCGDKN